MHFSTSTRIASRDPTKRLSRYAFNMAHMLRGVYSFHRRCIHCRYSQVDHMNECRR